MSPWVAGETLTEDNMVIVAGEITTQAKIDCEKTVRGVVLKIGFDSYVDDLSSVDNVNFTGGFAERTPVIKGWQTTMCWVATWNGSRRSTRRQTASSGEGEQPVG